MASRDEEKKRRRQKRLQKRARSQRPGEGQIPKLERALQLLDQLGTLPPASYPAGGDPSLARPDQIKFDLAGWATTQEPGRSKLKHLEAAARKGMLGDLPDFVDHWLWEEFFWHGVPGDSWQPVDAFLAEQGPRFPPAAAEQLRLWKAAKLGLYEIVEVHEDTISLRDWDPFQGTPVGSPKRAISLNIGGAHSYQRSKGAITFTYLAPWVPADQLYCTMGYGLTLPKRDVAGLMPYLGLQHPEVVFRPLPWKVDRAAAAEYLRQWLAREWHSWLSEQLQFPFWALVAAPPDGKPKLLQVTELLPSTPTQARQFGIYLAVPDKDRMLAAGGTTVAPIDVTAPNALALMEYQAYRERVGPPPGTRGLPPFTEVR